MSVLEEILGTINPVAFEVGPLQIRWYALIIVTGILLAIWLATREAQRLNVDPDDLFDMMLWALPIAIIGARLYYVIFRWSYYSAHPGEIIQIWQGGLAIYGGLIAGGIVFIVFARSKFLSPWLILDIAAPTVMLAQALGRWGNFVNQEAYGAKTTLGQLQSLFLPNWLTNQMYIGDAYRQPTFLYESTWNLIGFAIIMYLRHKKGLFKQGEIFLSYLIWYGFGRFFIEGMRTDSLMFFGIMRVSQVLSLLLFLGAIILWIYRRRNKDLRLYLDGAEFTKKVGKEKNDD